MITPKCSKCGEELQTPGGLAFSEPRSETSDQRAEIVHKYHLCINCWQEFRLWLVSTKVASAQTVVLVTDIEH